MFTLRRVLSYFGAILRGRFGPSNQGNEWPVLTFAVDSSGHTAPARQRQLPGKLICTGEKVGVVNLKCDRGAVCWSSESQLNFIAVPLTATIIIPLVSPKTS